MGAEAVMSTSASARAMALTERALAEALEERGGRIAPATETAVQNALQLLRVEGGDPALVRKLETVSTLLFTMAHAQLTGRVNLHASSLVRLRKLAFA